MSETPTTYVAIDGIDPEELTTIEVNDLSEAIRDYCDDTFEPDHVPNVVVSSEPFEN